MTDGKAFRVDPRTVARGIPGLFDAVFPQLAPGVAVHFNRGWTKCHQCEAVPEYLVSASQLQHAMLFEVAVAAGEQLLASAQVDWDVALGVAVQRQRRHFDAKIPQELASLDIEVAYRVAKNLEVMLQQERAEQRDEVLVKAPCIPGYQWIASGVGDFSVNRVLIEVKCTNRPFSTADYRQVLLYWLLSYAASIEDRGQEWSHVVLMNPRLNKMVRISLDELVSVTGAGRTKIDVLEVFSSLVGDHSMRLLGHM